MFIHTLKPTAILFPSPTYRFPFLFILSIINFIPTIIGYLIDYILLQARLNCIYKLELISDLLWNWYSVIDVLLQRIDTSQLSTYIYTKGGKIAIQVIRQGF